MHETGIFTVRVRKNHQSGIDNSILFAADHFLPIQNYYGSVTRVFQQEKRDFSTRTRFSNPGQTSFSMPFQVAPILEVQEPLR